MVGTCKDSITGWENGRSVPHIHFYPGIIDFLGYIPFETSEETLEARIKTFRLTHGLSQKKLGKLLSVDESTIKSWENGRRVPNESRLKKIEEILDRKRPCIK